MKYLLVTCRVFAATTWSVLVAIMWHFYFPIVVTRGAVQPVAMQTCKEIKGCADAVAITEYRDNEHRYATIVKVLSESNGNSEKVVKDFHVAYAANVEQFNFLTKSLARYAEIKGVKQ